MWKRIQEEMVQEKEREALEEAEKEKQALKDKENAGKELEATKDIVEERKQVQIEAA